MGLPAGICPTQPQWSLCRGAIVLLALACAEAAPLAGSRGLRASPRQERHIFEDRLSATRRALMAAQTNLAELERGNEELDPDDGAAGPSNELERWPSERPEAPSDDALLRYAHVRTQTAQPAYAPGDGVEVKRWEVPEGPSQDYNAETQIHSDIPWTYETCIAMFFICIIVGGPVLVQWHTHEKATRTVILQAGLTVVVLAGGIYAFCNIILFNSSHFTGERNLTIVECVYLMAQIITTVGYGDIVPAHPRGQVVVGCFVLLSLFLIVDMVSQVSQLVIERVESYTMELTEDAFEAMTNPDHEPGINPDNSAYFRKPEVSMISVIATGSVLLVFVLGGVLFYHFYPGEEKTWLQAIYMSVVTLTTTGFGAFTAVTTGGQVFGAFWMIFGVAALVSFVGAFAELIMKIKETERHCPDSVRSEMEANLRKVGQHRKGKLNSVEFLRFAVLQTHISSEEQLASIEHWFDDMAPDHHGHVHLDAIDRKMKLDTNRPG